MNAYKQIFGFAAAALLTFGLFAGCDTRTTPNGPETLDKGAVKPTLDTPTLTHISSSGTTITVRVTAGASGAPAGFSIQWVSKADYDAYGGWGGLGAATEPTTYCEQSFSGNATGVFNGSTFRLAAGASIDIQLGSIITAAGASAPGCFLFECDGEQWVFRCFAHATSSAYRSAFSGNLVAQTDNCTTQGCTYSQGYWKNHSNLWPAPYSPNDIWGPDPTKTWLGIMLTAPKGNANIILAHQYIAALLNGAFGAGSVTVSYSGGTTTIAAIVSASTSHFDGTMPLTSAQVLEYAAILEDYNVGDIGPGHCQ
jgi:hypothetical protein